MASISYWKVEKGTWDDHAEPKYFEKRENAYSWARREAGQFIVQAHRIPKPWTPSRLPVEITSLQRSLVDKYLNENVSPGPVLRRSSEVEWRPSLATVTQDDGVVYLKVAWDYRVVLHVTVEQSMLGSDDKTYTRQETDTKVLQDWTRWKVWHRATYRSQEEDVTSELPWYISEVKIEFSDEELQSA